MRKFFGLLLMVIGIAVLSHSDEGVPIRKNYFGWIVTVIGMGLVVHKGKEGDGEGF